MSSPSPMELCGSPVYVATMKPGMIPYPLVLFWLRHSFPPMKSSCQFHGSYKIIGILSRRPGFHALARGRTHSAALGGVRENIAQNFRQCIDISRRKDVPSFSVAHEIVFCTDSVADGGRAAAKHGLIHDEPETFVQGGEHEQVRRGINVRKLRLIHKSKETEPF